MMKITYDIETLRNCFSLCSLDDNGKDWNEFVIHKDRNDSAALYEFLGQVKGMIGFNNLHFDYPVIHKFLEKYRLWKYLDGDQIASLLYQEAQNIIAGTNEKIKQIYIPQLDLFKIWHFDNKAKTQSLKGIEIWLNFPNVQDMPIHHGDEVSGSQIEEILAYNRNDVQATYDFYKNKKTKEKIDLRIQLSKKYGIDFMNASDSKIGEEVTLKLYCEKAGKIIDLVRKRNTHRKQIEVSKLLFDYIHFNEPVFQQFLTRLKETTFYLKDGLKGQYSETIEFGGLEFHYGMGGLHASVENKVFESDNTMIIKDLDVASLYPSLALVNRFYPHHLGKQFCEVYENDVVNVRLDAKKKSKDKSLTEDERYMYTQLAEALKLAANSVYGKSNSEYSFLYDPAYTLRTTINGQLLLTMLAEILVKISGLQLIQINTDGITSILPRDQEELYYKICDSWMKKTKLQLEYINYSKMVLNDVNNYIAIKEGFDGTYETDSLHLKDVKYKGSYEIEKEAHKDPSFKIIPFALSEYFCKGVPIADTISTNQDIFMFTGRMRCKSDSYLVQRYLKEGEVIEDVQQKTTRYYVSIDGRPLVKKYYPKPDPKTGKMKAAKESQVNKGYKTAIYNKHVEKSFEEYRIDKSFYIQECQKIIEAFYPVKYKLELWTA